MRRTVCQKQHDVSDCGVACLASVAAYYGLEMPLARLRQLASTTREGTNVQGLLQAAQSLGLEGRGVKSRHSDGRPNPEPLSGIELPAIAHLVKNGKLLHFVVIYRVGHGQVRLMDPASGRMETVPMETFVGEWTGVLVLLQKSGNFQPGRHTASLTKRLLQLMRPCRRQVAGIVASSLLFTLLGLATAIFIQKLIDDILPSGNLRQLGLYSSIMLGLLLLMLGCGRLKGTLTIRTGLDLDARLVPGYYRHLLHLPQPFFDSMQPGELVSRVNDAAGIRQFVVQTLPDLAVDLFSLLLSLLLMLTMHWKLALPMLLLPPLFLMLYAIYNRMNRLTQRQFMERSAAWSARLVESIQSIGTIRQLGLQTHTDKRLADCFGQTQQTAARAGREALWASQSIFFLAQLFTLLLLWYGGHLVTGGTLSVGELVSFYTLSSCFIGPASSVVGLSRSLQNARIAADRLFDILDLEPEPADGELTAIPEGDIRFEDVHFHYGAQKEVLRGFSATLRRGKTSALVGESGSGKTTLAALVQGLYAPTSGTVYIGDTPLGRLSKSHLRAAIGVVPQRIDLFEGTLMDNIVLDDPQPNYRRALELCQASGLLRQTERLAQGVNTDIGENGWRLSGGQRQLLALVRALYRQPRLLILDEPTAWLDTIAEENIKQLLNDCRRAGTTVLLIAHRLSSVVSADEIFVLSDGRLAEQGTHSELLARKGLYARYWAAQTNSGTALPATIAAIGPATGPSAISRLNSAGLAL